MKLFKKVKKGFTLVELVVVIAVIAVLAAVSVGAFFGVTESAKSSKLEQEAKQVHTAIQLVGNTNSDNHQLTSEGLEVVDLGVFEDALNDVIGLNYEVYEDGETQIAGNAVILKAVQTNGLVGAKRYSSFEYYSPTTGNAAGVVDIKTGKYSKQVNKNISVSSLLTTTKEVNDAISKASTDSSNPTLIKLGASMVFEDNLLVDGKSIILDLNGYTVGAVQKSGVEDTEGTQYNDLFVLRAINGANVTITGNGTMHFSSDTLRAAAVIGAYEGTTITIKNGNFHANPIEGGTVLYSKGSGLINVEGGSFDPVAKHTNPERYFLFNKTCTTAECTELKQNGGWDSSHTSCQVPHFNVTGGTFYRTNEGLSSETPYVNGCSHVFVPKDKGYKVVEHEDSTPEIRIWEVVKA